MTVRLLCIANPGAYRGVRTDVPLSYARLASAPGIELWHADTSAMMVREDAIAATPIAAGFDPADFGALDPAGATRRAVADFDLAFCRTLKPFPSGYLDALAARTPELPFVNAPRGIRRQLEHDFFLEAAGAWLPEACVADDGQVIDDFLARHRTIVIKRANSCGGRGVFRATADAPGSRTAIELEDSRGSRRCFEDGPALFAALHAESGEALLLVRYLHRVAEGEKRILVLDGEILGAYLRRARAGGWIQNVSSGARVSAAAVSDAERALVADTAPHYRALGLHTLGYDLLRDDDGAWRLSEINAGNIGGFARLEGLEELGAPDSMRRLGDWLVDFAARSRPTRSAPSKSRQPGGPGRS